MKYLTLPSVGALFVFMIFMLATAESDANGKVKYCRNATTGEIITVQAGYPCPFPTHAI